MEALYLVCGARRPQLKRDPLGSSMPHRYVRPILMATLLSCGPYRAPAPITGGRDATIGCYQLTLVPMPSTRPFTDSGAAPPAVIQLHLTGRLTPSWSAFGYRFNAFPGNWRLARTDSLLLEWTDGMGGVSVNLHPHGDSLVGTATYWFREGSDGPLAQVPGHAVSIKCP